MSRPMPSHGRQHAAMKEQLTGTSHFFKGHPIISPKVSDTNYDLESTMCLKIKVLKIVQRTSMIKGVGTRASSPVMDTSACLVV